MKKKISTLYLARIAMMAAVASVLMILEFQIPVFLSFLKFDFSNVVVLLGGFVMGPIEAICIIVIKGAVNLLFSTSGGVGVLADVLVSIGLVVPSSLLYRRFHTRRGLMLSMLAGVFFMCVMAAAANLTIILPFYTEVAQFISMEGIYKMTNALIPDALSSRWPLFVVDNKLKLILLGFMPFNIFKGIVLAVITVILQKYLGRYLAPERKK